MENTQNGAYMLQYGFFSITVAKHEVFEKYAEIRAMYPKAVIDVIDLETAELVNWNPNK